MNLPPSAISITPTQATDTLHQTVWQLWQRFCESKRKQRGDASCSIRDEEEDKMQQCAPIIDVVFLSENNVPDEPWSDQLPILSNYTTPMSSGSGCTTPWLSSSCCPSSLPTRPLWTICVCEKVLSSPALWKLLPTEGLPQEVAFLLTGNERHLRQGALWVSACQRLGADASARVECFHGVRDEQFHVMPLAVRVCPRGPAVATACLRERVRYLFRWLALFLWGNSIAISAIREDAHWNVHCVVAELSNTAPPIALPGSRKVFEATWIQVWKHEQTYVFVFATVWATSPERFSFALNEVLPHLLGYVCLGLWSLVSAPPAFPDERDLPLLAALGCQQPLLACNRLLPPFAAETAPTAVPSLSSSLSPSDTSDDDDDVEVEDDDQDAHLVLAQNALEDVIRRRRSSVLPAALAREPNLFVPGDAARVVEIAEVEQTDAYPVDYRPQLGDTFLAEWIFPTQVLDMERARPDQYRVVRIEHVIEHLRNDKSILVIGVVREEPGHPHEMRPIASGPHDTYDKIFWFEYADRHAWWYPPPLVTDEGCSPPYYQVSGWNLAQSEMPEQQNDNDDAQPIHNPAPHPLGSLIMTAPWEEDEQKATTDAHPLQRRRRQATGSSSGNASCLHRVVRCQWLPSGQLSRLFTVPDDVALWNGILEPSCLTCWQFTANNTALALPQATCSTIHFHCHEHDVMRVRQQRV